MQNQEMIAIMGRPQNECGQKIIILVEDNEIFSHIIKYTIEGFTRHRVIVLEDGSRLLEVLNENQPHLLLLDYDLPGQNGIELYDLVHTTNGWEHLPAIMVSADLPMRALARRKLPGLRKPCKTDELLQAIEKALA